MKQIIEKYKHGKIDAKEYGERMFASYEILIELKELIKVSIVDKIEITKDKVIVTTRQNNNYIKMEIHPVDSGSVPTTIVSLGDYEAEELDMVINLLNMLDRDSVVFDVGANLGWYTLNMLKNSPDIQVHSFEPVKETYLKLKENLLINEFKTINAYNFGLYKENRELEFFYDITATGASSLSDLRERSTTRKVVCEFKKMDDFVKENDIKRLDFIKCDVEGSELFVYEGGIESIKKFKPIVFSEMLRKWSAKFDYHPNDIINLFKGIEYKCFVISGSKLKEIEIVDESTVETNYFFLHKDKHKDIINEFCINNN